MEQHPCEASQTQQTQPVTAAAATKPAAKAAGQRNKTIISAARAVSEYIDLYRDHVPEDKLLIMLDKVRLLTVMARAFTALDPDELEADAAQAADNAAEDLLGVCDEIWSAMVDRECDHDHDGDDGDDEEDADSGADGQDDDKSGSKSASSGAAKNAKVNNKVPRHEVAKMPAVKPKRTLPDWPAPAAVEK